MECRICSARLIRPIDVPGLAVCQELDMFLPFTGIYFLCPFKREWEFNIKQKEIARNESLVHIGSTLWSPEHN